MAVSKELRNRVEKLYDNLEQKYSEPPTLSSCLARTIEYRKSLPGRDFYGIWANNGKDSPIVKSVNAILRNKTGHINICELGSGPGRIARWVLDNLEYTESVSYYAVDFEGIHLFIHQFLGKCEVRVWEDSKLGYFKDTEDTYIDTYSYEACKNRECVIPSTLDILNLEDMDIIIIGSTEYDTYDLFTSYFPKITKSKASLIIANKLRPRTSKSHIAYVESLGFELKRLMIHKGPYDIKHNIDNICYFKDTKKRTIRNVFLEFIRRS